MLRRTEIAMYLVIDQRDADRITASAVPVRFPIRQYWQGPAGELVVLADGVVTFHDVRGMADSILSHLRDNGTGGPSEENPFLKH